MKILVAIPTAQSDEQIESLIATMPPEVLALAAVRASHRSGFSSQNRLQVYDLNENGSRRDLLVKASRCAQATGASSLIVFDPQAGHLSQDIGAFIAAAHETPAAIVVGVRQFDRSQPRQGPGLGRRLAAFGLRLQTGSKLSDPGCRYRLYPVAVLDRLPCFTSGASFETEILVRAAWAGIPLRDVDLHTPRPTASPARPFGRRVVDACVAAALQTHLTMRSITPVPHRKLVTSAADPSRKISVLRPLQSIKTLLTENVSPRRLAFAGALGVFLGTLPLIALHTVAILFAAGFFRLNKVAALAASQLCMPPLVPAVCIEAGYLMRHGHFLTEISIETLGYQALERIFEWVLGALVVAPVLALLCGAVLYAIAVLMRRSMQNTDDHSLS